MCPNFLPVLYVHINKILSKVINFLFVEDVIIAVIKLFLLSWLDLANLWKSVLNLLLVVLAKGKASLLLSCILIKLA